MPSSATWDGQLTGPGVVDPWSPKPTSGPAADPWGMQAPIAQSHPPVVQSHAPIVQSYPPVVQSHPSMPSTVNDPWAPSPAPVTTSELIIYPSLFDELASQFLCIIITIIIIYTFPCHHGL